MQLATNRRPKQNTPISFADALAATAENEGSRGNLSVFQPESVDTTGSSTTDLEQDFSFDPQQPESTASNSLTNSKWQEAEERRRRIEALKQRHDDITGNGKKGEQVFFQRQVKAERETEQRLEAVRAELEAMCKQPVQGAAPLVKTDQEIQRPLFEPIVNPGPQGTYLTIFFHILRGELQGKRALSISAAGIARQIREARMARKRNRTSFEGKSGAKEEAETVFNRMHHENAASDGA